MCMGIWEIKVLAYERLITQCLLDCNCTVNECLLEMHVTATVPLKGKLPPPRETQIASRTTRFS